MCIITVMTIVMHELSWLALAMVYGLLSLWSLLIQLPWIITIYDYSNWLSVFTMGYKLMMGDYYYDNHNFSPGLIVTLWLLWNFIGTNTNHPPNKYQVPLIDALPKWIDPILNQRFKWGKRCILFKCSHQHISMISIPISRRNSDRSDRYQRSSFP